MAFSYPQLTYEEIFDYFDLIQFMPDSKITRQDFKKPEALRWRCIYASFMELITEQKVEDIFQREKLRRPHREYSEIYEDAINLVSFSRKMATLMKVCGVHDFTLKDLMTPGNEQRLRFHASALINFLKFIGFQKDTFQDVEEQFNEEEKQRKELIAANNDLRRKIDSLRLNQERTSVAAQQLKQENAIKREELEGMMAQRAEVEAVNKEMEGEKVKLISATKEIGVKVIETQKELESLKSFLVKPPNFYLDQMSRLDAKARHLDERIQEQKEKIQVQSERRDDSKKLVAMWKAKIADLTAIRDLEAQVKMQSNEPEKPLQDERDRDRQLNRDLEELSAHYVFLQEQFAKEERQHDYEIAAYEQTLKDYEMENAAREKAAGDAKVRHDKEKRKFIEEMSLKEKKLEEDTEFWNKLEKDCQFKYDQWLESLVSEIAEIKNKPKEHVKKMLTRQQ